MQINTLAIATGAAQLVASVGVSKVVKDIITNNTTVETAADNAQVWVGAVVIGTMATDAASDFTTKKIEKTVAAVRKFKNRKDDTETE